MSLQLQRNSMNAFMIETDPWPRDWLSSPRRNANSKSPRTPAPQTLVVIAFPGKKCPGPHKPKQNKLKYRTNIATPTNHGLHGGFYWWNGSLTINSACPNLKPTVKFPSHCYPWVSSNNVTLCDQWSAISCDKYKWKLILILIPDTDTDTDIADTW